MPQRALSRFAGWMANCEIPWIKNLLIRYFVNRYTVNMEEAVVQDPYSYPSFNAFFTRAINGTARPITMGLHDIASPADGVISQIGKIEDTLIIQAKNHLYSVSDLLGNDENLSKNFQDGSFITIYLAPPDYHRVHMPIDGKLSEMIYVPGKLFSVNAETTDNIPNLFALNERVISIFNTSIGRVAVVLVGAMLVGSIETIWAGAVTSQNGVEGMQKRIQKWQYDDTPRLKRGEELGRFKMGSTVIVLFEKNAVSWDLGLTDGERVQVGMRLGTSDYKHILAHTT